MVSLVKKLGLTLVLQGVGVVAMMLVNIIIAHRYGPQGQGYLSHYRSTVLLVVQLGLIGLPQAMVYMINSGVTSRRWAVHFSSLYGVLFGVVAAAVCALAYGIAGESALGFDSLAMIAIVFAATGQLLFELYRAIALATKSVLVFNLISILPALLALCLFGMWAAEQFQVLVLVLVIASSLAAGFGLLVLGENPLSSPEEPLRQSGSKLKTSFTFGFFTCVPSILFHLVAVATYGCLRSTSDASAGQFSVSLLILNFALLPLERVAPLLFDTWSKKSSGVDRRWSFAMLAHLGSLIALTAAVGGIFLAGPVIQLLFGEEFQPAVLPTQILMFTAYAFYQSRLQASLLLSLGQPKIITLAAILRAGVVLGCLFFGQIDSVYHAALAWATGEGVALLLLSCSVSRLTEWPLWEVCGLSPTWIARAWSEKFTQQPKSDLA